MTEAGGNVREMESVNERIVTTLSRERESETYLSLSQKSLSDQWMVVLVFM